MHTVTPGGKVTNRLSTYRDLSPYFEHSRVARNSRAYDVARLQGAAFRLYAAWMDVWQIDVLFAWLDHKITEGATR